MECLTKSHEVIFTSHYIDIWKAVVQKMISSEILNGIVCVFTKQQNMWFKKKQKLLNKLQKYDKVER